MLDGRRPRWPRRSGPLRALSSWSRGTSAVVEGHVVDLAHGGRVTVWDWSGPVGAPTLVLLHGSTLDAELNWFASVAALNRYFRVVTFDLRGHGRGAPARLPFRLEDCVDDVAEIVRALDTGPVIAVGYSMGGLIAQLMAKGHIREGAMTANGKTMGDNNRGRKIGDPDVIFPIEKPMREDAGFIILKGNLFNNAVMKTSVISPEFAERYLSNPKDPGAFEGRAIVFEGPEDYHHRIDDPSLEIDGHSGLFIRGAGPIGHPGAAEVVNMDPPAALLKRGITELPCIGDGRQSGTSGSPSILNASPEAAARLRRP